MRYQLSKLIPMRMRSVYSASDGCVHITKWWQWRGRCFGIHDRATRCYVV